MKFVRLVGKGYAYDRRLWKLNSQLWDIYRMGEVVREDLRKKIVWWNR